MSIPPLVCSTPPPPEQCEDDKDQEDFDMNYHLCQDDDESNDYDYSNFSNFNHFESTTSKTNKVFEMSQDEKKNDIAPCGNINETNDEQKNTKPDKINSKTSLEDDILEDLNLKIDLEPAGSIQKNVNDDCDTISTEKCMTPQKDLEADIPIDNSISEQAFEMKNDDLEIANTDAAVDSKTDLNELPSLPDEIVTIKSDDSTPDELCNINTFEETSFSMLNSDIIETFKDPQKHQPNADTLGNDLDQFEDFDDFQFASSVAKPSEAIDISSDNPWQNDIPKDDGFGDFTANFEESECAVLQQKSSEEAFTCEKQHDEDDFGDFDEFKSVNDIEINTISSEYCNEVPVLNFQSSDSEYQIIERINKVMHSIFQNEIGESDNVFENKLESSLGETWSYLRETDIRQPYIVNWNNSLAQKTLLKALCIDSRNILFGPKWSSSMPKYAATLSAAPLQPQKQAGQPSVSQSDISNSEKTMNKTWSDPFTADGQESCHTDRENTVIETGPTDLDVFEAAISTKPDKIYSNTIGIQPMRQINLPDTHIFTPTNSEIPRSKTIHYDDTSTPTVLLPQSVSDNSASQLAHSENDSDYWEFQDFRGITHNNKAQESTKEEAKDQKDVTHKSNLPLATQVLQPIKLEPIMPTLNWPDPGEVKETFDDFSDFMSNSQSSNEKQEPIPHISTNLDKNQSPDKVEINQTESNNNAKLEDEFEMFQSALPSFKTTPECDFITADRNQASSSQVVHNKLTDFDIVFSKVNKVKSENISPATKPLENVVKNVNNTSLFKAQPVSSTAVQMTNTNILQPSLATSSSSKASQQKASQILEPLSLESYSQINWPNPGINLQDLSRFNPVESLQSLKNDSNSQSKSASPVHNQKSLSNQASDEDIWGEFVSSKPKQQQTMAKKQTTFADDDEWTDFVSSPSAIPQNGLNTISLNVHTNSNLQKSSTKYPLKANDISLDIPTLNYITPKNNKSFTERHFQNL